MIKMTTPTDPFSTLALHGAEEARSAAAPVSPSPVTATSFFADPSAIGFSANDMASKAPPFYTRWGNPTVSLLEERLTLLEGGEGAVCYASGMGAVAGLFAARLKAGDHLVFSDVCYAGVAELVNDWLPRQGIEVSFADTSDPAAVAAVLRPGQTRLIHIETPANPILKLTDIATMATLAHDIGAELSVDSTIATPIATQPLKLGADFVVHSLTKYICGHGDALGGAVIVKDPAHLAALRAGVLVHMGAPLAPLSAWLILRGLETLPLRMEKHEANARILTEFLQNHSAVRSVLWPGLAGGAQAVLAQRQMQNFSGLLSFSLHKDSAATAQRMFEEFRTISYAVSLGKTKSLMFHIGTEDILRSSFRLSAASEAAYRDAAGEGVFRFSVGLENPADLISDLEHVLGHG